jgi:hypothetical protein
MAEIVISGPDGSTFSFPEGTGSDVIKRAMQKRYAAKSSFDPDAYLKGDEAAAPKQEPISDIMVAPLAVVAVGLSPALIFFAGVGLSALSERRDRFKAQGVQGSQSTSPLASLNGWQRLGIVLSALWMLVATAGGIIIGAAIGWSDFSLAWFALALYAALVLLWALGWAVSWIMAGFRRSRA